MATSLFDLNDLNGSNGFVIRGTTQEDRLGTKVDLTGDLNGDGIEDIVITTIDGGDDSTASYSYNYSDRRGEAYVIFGNNNLSLNSAFNLNELNGNNGFRVAGVNEDDNLGSAISVGDINGDGIDDLAIGAPYGGSRTTSYGYEYSRGEGRAYIIFGRQNGFDANVDLNSLDENDGFSLGGIDAGDNLGAAIASAGDINGDGIDDIAVSATGAGRIISNGNGYSYSDRRGETFVVFGKRNFNSNVNSALLNGSDGFRIEGKDANDRLGQNLSNAGDINGDGIDDLVIGTPEAGEILDSPYAYGDSDRRGETYVIFGRNNGFNSTLNLNNLNGNNGFAIAGVGIEDNLGSAVSNAGDINGDGIDDLVLGAQQASQTGEYSFEGGAYVVFGKNTGFNARFDLNNLNGTNGFSIPGLELDDNFGNAVSVGDINDDGIDDVIIAANTAGQTITAPDSYRYSDRRGEVYIIYGKNSGFDSEINLESLSSLDGAKITGIGRDDLLGSAIGSGGDVNNDGKEDLILSAPEDNVRGDYTREGEAYVIFQSQTKSGRIIGTSQNDLLDGTSNSEEILGLLGDDTIDGKRGNDIIRGGGGKDRLTGSSGNDLINGNEGNDTIVGNSGNDTLVGSDGRDVLKGNNGRDLIRGGANNDNLNGNEKQDTLFGEAGNDTLRGGSAEDTLDGGNGKDLLFGNSGADLLVGKAGNDVLNGEGGNDTLTGNQNDDTLRGSQGRDRLNGGKGNDVLYGGSEADVLFGNEGNDTLDGGNGNDRLDGNNNADLIYGKNGADILIGGFGNDTLFGGIGNDSLNGKADNDVLDATKSSNTSNSNFGLSELDTLTGGTGSDIFTLGDSGQVYYDDQIGYTKGINDFALINDLDLDRDIIKMTGRKNEYELNIYNNSSGGFNAEIVYNPGNYLLGELIGVLEDVPRDLNLSDPVFAII